MVQDSSQDLSENVTGSDIAENNYLGDETHGSTLGTLETMQEEEEQTELPPKKRAVKASQKSLAKISKAASRNSSAAPPANFANASSPQDTIQNPGKILSASK